MSSYCETTILLDTKQQASLSPLCLETMSIGAAAVPNIAFGRAGRRREPQRGGASVAVTGESIKAGDQ